MDCEFLCYGVQQTVADRLRGMLLWLFVKVVILVVVQTFLIDFMIEWGPLLRYTHLQSKRRNRNWSSIKLKLLVLDYLLNLLWSSSMIFQVNFMHFLLNCEFSNFRTNSWSSILEQWLYGTFTLFAVGNLRLLSHNLIRWSYQGDFVPCKYISGEDFTLDIFYHINHDFSTLNIV